LGLQLDSNKPELKIEDFDPETGIALRSTNFYAEWSTALDY